MTDRELLYVTTIAQEGSLTRAAQRLYITQPALSHSLAGIEEALGQPLFRRESRGLVLTYAGERYCETAREILKMYGDLEQELGELEGLRRGRALIGMTRFLSMELMPEVLPRYRAQYPGIEVLLWEEPSTRLLEMLSTRQLDLGVMNLTQEEAERMDRSHHCHLLYQDPFVIAVARGDPIGRAAVPGGPGQLAVLDPRLLRDRAFSAVVAGQRIRRVTDRVFHQAGISPEIMFTSSSFETARRVACAGGGAAMLPSRYAALFAARGDADYYALPEEYHAILFAAAVRPRGSYLPAAAARFLELLEEQCGHAPSAP